MKTAISLREILLALGLAFGLSLMAAPAQAAPPSGGGEEAGEDSRRRTITSSSTYMPLRPLMAPVQSNRRSRGLLQIEAGLEIEDPRLRDRVERYMPRLRNAYVSALSVYTGMNYRYGEVPDADRIAELLQEATDVTLGQPGADVLIGMIIIHAD